MSKLEEALAFQIRALKLPEPEREYRFAAIATGGTGAGVRQRVKAAGLKDWRFDFCWPGSMFAVEIEGGGFVNGRHNRGPGFQDDMLKYSEAMYRGWTVYRCDAGLIKSGKALAVIEMLVERGIGEVA
jgi:hypothetical protein